MSEVISIHFPDISGDVATTYNVYLRSESGLLLNTGGDVIVELGATGRWTFTLGEDRVAQADYYVRVYAGSQTAANLVYDGILYAGQTVVDKPFSSVNLTMIRGIVGTTNLTTTSLKCSTVNVAPSIVNQWVGRIIIFDNDTTTASLRGQATDITAMTADALPILTFTALTTPPASGDKFSIV
jgi:hypothetical protein